jgi:hypothetical protein
MRFHRGAPPSSFRHSPRWQRLREAPLEKVTLVTLPIALGAAAGVSTLWHLAGVTFSQQFSALARGNALHTIALLVALVVVHEALHLLAHPRSGITNRSIIGASAKPFMFYAAYLGPMRRNRMVLMLAAPFLLLSVLPLAAYGFTSLPLTYMPTVALLGVVNSAMASIDLYGVALLLQQVPGGAVVQNDGWSTYWNNGAA